MNCDGVSILLSAYLDGELTPGELLRVEEHLRRCHACADEVDSLRQTVALVASLEEVEVPVSFQAQLHQRLVALGPPVAVGPRTRAVPAWQRGVRRWAAPAAAAAAALAIGVSTYGQWGQLSGGLNGGVGNFTHQPPPKLAVTDQQPAVDPVDPDKGVQITDVRQPDVTTLPPPENNISEPPAPVVAPGPTDVIDGPRVVTATPDPGTSVAAEPKMVYHYNIVVKETLHEETLALIRSENILATLGENGTLTAKVPVANREAALERYSTVYFPGATIDDDSQDIALDIAGAERRLKQAEQRLEQNTKLAGAVQDSDQKAVAELKDELAELVRQTTYVTFVVTFTP
ncbi:MAG TPA: zf-HC2 domain-containing protein [Symbiobacteriaceae bacterium]|nr:zf-HC2 domain-containing protein [Symbiobacteriaceae bacterium]